MSAYLGAVSITDKRGAQLRLQIGPVGMVRGVDGSRHPASMGGRYRAARSNGWHCGHWHRTPEDAVACAIAKGAPMD